MCLSLYLTHSRTIAGYRWFRRFEITDSLNDIRNQLYLNDINNGF